MERCKIDEDSKSNIDATEHTSDRLCRTALLVRKSRYNRNNSQNDLSDYVSSTSLSARDHNQIKIHYISEIPKCNNKINQEFRGPRDLMIGKMIIINSRNIK